MAEINAGDIISKEAQEEPLKLKRSVDEAIKSIEKLQAIAKQSETNILAAKTVNQVTNETKKLSSAQQELEALQKNIAASAKQRYQQEAQSLDQLIQKRETLKQKIKDLVKDQKEDLQLLRDGTISRQEYTKRLTDANREISVLKQRIQGLNAETKREIQSTQLLGNEYQKLTVALERARATYKNLAASGTATTDQLKAQQKIVEELNKKVTAIDNAVGQFQRNVGNYPATFNAAGNALRNFLGAFGLVSGVVLFAKILKDAIALTIEYEYVNSKIKAVLGATTIQTMELRAQQQELGRTTEFTAAQVAKMQLELSKLGFPTAAIIDMTESTLDAALAMGSDLGEQAALTGATLRAFGLQAKDTQRVNDVLAASTSKSGLDFQKLATAMPYVAANAKALGITLEGTAALMGRLANAGFQASTIGTTLRNIFLKLADSGSNLSKSLKEPVTDTPSLLRALKQLHDEGINLGEAFELTDQRAVSAFLTLVSGVDEVTALEKAMNEAKGTADAMAKTMGDNLRGDVLLFTSAWQGLILYITEGDSAFSRLTRGIVQAATAFINFITPVKDATREIYKEQIQLNGLVIAIQNATGSQEVRNKLIDDLNQKYPAFLGNLNKEAVTNEELAKRLSEVNEQFQRKILLASAEGKLKDVSDQIIESIDKEAEARQRLEEIRAAGPGRGFGVEGTGISTGGSLIQEQKIQEQQDIINEQIIERTRLQADLQKRLLAYNDALKIFNSTNNDYFKKNEEITQQEEDQINRKVRLTEEQKKYLEAERKARFELEKMGIESDIKLSDSTQERVDNEIRLEMFLMQEKLRGIKSGSAQELLIIEQTQAKINEIIAKGNDDQLDEVIKGIREQGAARSLEQQKIIDNQILAIQNEVAQGIITRQEGDKQIAVIKRSFADELVQIEIDTTEKILQLANLTNEERADLEKKLYQLKVNLNNAFYDQLQDQDQTWVEKAKETTESLLAIYQDFISNGIGPLFDAFSARRIENINAEMKSVEEQYKRDVELAGDNSRAKEQIERDYEAKKKALERRRLQEEQQAARRAKVVAIFEAGIRTALAVLNQLAAPPALTAIPRSILAGAIGAVQIAAIAAKPIPQFEDGGTVKTAGPIIAGEAGKEMYVTPGGKIGFTPDVASVMRLPVGTEIYPHDETMKMLAMNSFNRIDSVRADMALYSRMESVENTIRETNGRIEKAIIENSGSDIVKHGSMLYEAKKKADGSKKLIRLKSLTQ